MFLAPPLLLQERATKVSHGNTARMAVEYGDDVSGGLEEAGGLCGVQRCGGCRAAEVPSQCIGDLTARQSAIVSLPTKLHHLPTPLMFQVLGKLCGAIASDESRHEIAYTRIVDEFFR